jgi:hypothetical protein
VEIVDIYMLTIMYIPVIVRVEVKRVKVTLKYNVLVKMYTLTVAQGDKGYHHVLWIAVAVDIHLKVTQKMAGELQVSQAQADLLEVIQPQTRGTEQTHRRK